MKVIKKMVVVAALYEILFCFFYMAAAFYTVNLNFATWDKEERGCFVFSCFIIGLVLSPIFIHVAEEITENIKNQ